MNLKSQNSTMLLAFLTLLGIVAIVALVGFFMLRKGPEIVQGQAEVTDYRVSSKVPGRILEFRVKEGQTVQAGDTLAILEAPDIQAKLEQARAAEAAAQAQNEKALKGARHEQVQAAYEMWQKAQAGLTIAEKSYKRVKNLFDQGVMSAQKLDEVTAQRDAAAATEKAAKAQYDMARNGAEREDKAAAAALVERAKGAVAEVQSYIQETILTAQMPGEVSEIFADRTIIATGRRGADWLEKMCAQHNIAHAPGVVDIGVRVEVRNEIMEEVNSVLYESKLIGYPAPFKNKVRIFCQNPGGFVSQENYDNDLAVVNGHSYKELKSENTNLAILCSHSFNQPFNQPIEYAQKVGELTNMLGAGKILVQRYGDILAGKRTWQKELGMSNVRPTLKDAVAGDITAAMPYRAMTNIINFIQAVDEVVPGFAGYETLLYSPELKFYSNKIKMDERLNTSIQGLHCLGDSSGWTRGLMMASVMGVLMARTIIEDEK